MAPAPAYPLRMCSSSLDERVSGTIDFDTKFFHRTLSDYPAKQVSLRYTIKYNVGIFPQPPILAIHTSMDEVSLSEKCYMNNFGQLRNENLRVPLPEMRGPYRYTNRKVINGTFLAEADHKIYDYLERNFSFSFGYDCESLGHNLSLKGIFYDVSINDHRNESRCTKIPNLVGYLKDCHQFYSQFSVQNLVGELGDVYQIDQNAKLLSRIEDLFLFVNVRLADLYQYYQELKCRILIPECHVEKEVVIHPCQEMGFDFLASFQEKIDSGNDFGIIPEDRIFSYLFNASYLPSSNGSIPCFYKPVLCAGPPVVAYAKPEQDGHEFPAKTTLKYSCVDTFVLEGNSTVTCLYSGNWSRPPVCTAPGSDLVAILVPVVSVLVMVVLLGVLVWLKCRKTRKIHKHVPRQTSCDAFVCYNFDNDNDYVISELLPELDEEFNNENIEEINHENNHCHQKFKIIFESRDFEPGLMIEENIKNAIDKCNCAIIVMSQGFLDSPWCRKEFQSCKLENERDGSFKIFIIMMQPVNELVNVNASMEEIFQTTTFLKKDDPDLLKKLKTNLRGLRRINGCPQ